MDDNKIYKDVCDIALKLNSGPAILIDKKYKETIIKAEKLKTLDLSYFLINFNIFFVESLHKIIGDFPLYKNMKLYDYYFSIFSKNENYVYTEIPIDIIYTEEISEKELLELLYSFKNHNFSIDTISYKYSLYEMDSNKDFIKNKEDVVIPNENILYWVKEKIRNFNFEIKEEEYKKSLINININKLNNEKNKYLELLSPEDRLLIEVDEC